MPALYAAVAPRGPTLAHDQDHERIVDELRTITSSGADALAQLGERLPELEQLDDVLPDCDLAEDLLEAKLALIERLHRRWREIWESLTDAAGKAATTIRRRLRNAAEACFKSRNAFLDSLQEGVNAGGLTVEAAGAHIAKEAKEFGEAAIAATRRY